MIQVQLTGEDFSNIHNGKCYLHGAIQRLEGVVNEKVVNELQRVYDLLEKGLQGAYAQEEAADKIREAAIQAVDAKHDFKSVWSMENYDFAGKVEPTPKYIRYTSYRGQAPISVGVNGDTWLEMWLAADAAIRYGGDENHIFIEDLKHVGDGVYELYTGS